MNAHDFDPGPSPIDASYFRRPEGLYERTSAGGIVARRGPDGPLIALAHEDDFPWFVLPKGGVEPGETLEQAARREILEETGLSELRLVAALGSRARLSYYKKSWLTTHFFLYTTSQENGQPTDREHHDACWWFPPENLPPMLWPEQAELVLSNVDRIRAALEAT